jgi:chaperone modulatory protein CbpM
MTKKTIVIVADYTEEQPLSLNELCDICQITPDFIYTLVEYGILSPKGEKEQTWLFDVVHLQRVKTAIRLQHDLEVNLPGIAIVLDLLDEMETLRQRAEVLERHFLAR